MITLSIVLADQQCVALLAYDDSWASRKAMPK